MNEDVAKYLPKHRFAWAIPTPSGISLHVSDGQVLRPLPVAEWPEHARFVPFAFATLPDAARDVPRFEADVRIVIARRADTRESLGDFRVVVRDRGFVMCGSLPPNDRLNVTAIGFVATRSVPHWVRRASERTGWHGPVPSSVRWRLVENAMPRRFEFGRKGRTCDLGSFVCAVLHAREQANTLIPEVIL